MYKLTVFIENGEKTITLPESIRIDGDTPHLYVRTVTIIWDYENITTEVNDVIEVESGDPIKLEQGSWMWNVLVAKLLKEGVILGYNTHSGTTTVRATSQLNLRGFGELLGFEKDTVIPSGQETTSVKIVNITHGLKFFTISSNIIDSSNNFDTDGNKSNIFLTLPITGQLNLKGGLDNHKDIDNYTPINKGAYNEITFNIEGNNGRTKLGSVLLELYIVNGGQGLPKEQSLREIYYNPATGFQSAERLYQKAKEEGLDVSRKNVKEWLLAQDTYTRYKPVVKRHKFRATWVSGLGEQIQMDLVDMGKYKDKNKGYYWILTAIEILSRFAFAIPVYRKDVKNVRAAVQELLRQFHTRFDKYPQLAQFDDGKEFYNFGVKELLEKHDIVYFSTQSDKKAAVVERFNRTLKTSMWKVFYSLGAYKWLDVLPELVDNYNNTKHSSIHMKPIDVNKKNEGLQAWTALFGHAFGDLPLAKYRVGDTVRVSKYKNVFTKGYEAGFSEEVFTISKVFPGDPVVYEIKDHEGEPIVGKFYQEELSPVDKKDSVYRVEKVLKTKTVRGKKLSLVKWKSYPASANSWVETDSIKSL